MKSEPTSLQVAALDDRTLFLAQRRFAAIEPLLSSGRTPAKVAEAARNLGVSVATMYRWLARYESVGHHPSTVRAALVLDVDQKVHIHEVLP